jgi:hypothetical protein
VNPVARENLIHELEHLVQHKPPMGTLYITVSRTICMLIAALEDDKISLAYPHTGKFDFVRRYRFASFCKARGFPMRNEIWWNVRVSRAVMSADATDAAQNIAECFSSVYRMSGPYGLRLHHMSWRSSADRQS